MDFASDVTIVAVNSVDDVDFSESMAGFAAVMAAVPHNGVVVVLAQTLDIIEQLCKQVAPPKKESRFRLETDPFLKEVAGVKTMTEFAVYLGSRDSHASLQCSALSSLPGVPAAS
jgi:hypothetical protein